MTGDALYAALLKETVAAGETRVTHHADGMTTWTFRPADGWPGRPAHPYPVLPTNGRLDAVLTPVFASDRPAAWRYSIEDDDTGITTALTEPEFLDLYLRLAERAVNAHGEAR